MKTQNEMAGTVGVSAATTSTALSTGVHIGSVSTALALADGKNGIAIFAGTFTILISIQTNLSKKWASGF